MDNLTLIIVLVVIIIGGGFFCFLLYKEVRRTEAIAKSLKNSLENLKKIGKLLEQENPPSSSEKEE